jgi:hypothetical protein
VRLCGLAGVETWVALRFTHATAARFRPRQISFFGRLEHLFLRLDLAVAGRRAEGLSGIAAGDRACGAQRS